MGIIVRRRLSTSSKCIFVFNAFVALGAVEAQADVKLQETYSTYQLRGLSRQAIHNDLHRVAKRDADGIIEGEVADHWDWNFKFAAIGDSCQVTSDEIVLKLKILLPTWVDDARADPATRKAWNRYFQELKAHEDGHKAIALEAAKQVNKLTHGATAPGSCTALERSLNRAAKQIVESSEKAQDQHEASLPLYTLE